MACVYTSVPVSWFVVERCGWCRVEHAVLRLLLAVIVPLYGKISSMLASCGSGSALPLRVVIEPDGISGVSFLSFICDFSEISDVNKVLVHMGLWSSHTACRNAANITRNSIFHMSFSRMRTQFAKKINNATATSLGLVLAFALPGMLVFTGNVVALTSVLRCSTFVAVLSSSSFAPDSGSYRSWR